MKILKYALSVFFFLGGIGFISQRNPLSGLILLILGGILLPPISERIKSKFNFWNNKGIRYVAYIVLFFFSGIFFEKDIFGKTIENNTKKSETKENITQSRNKSEETVISFNGNGEKLGEKIIDNEQQYKDEIEKQFQNDDADFWSEYDPIVKRRIYDLIKNKDCEGLQKEFKVTADNLDRIQNAGGSGSRNLQLMDFLDGKMKELKCYK